MKITDKVFHTLEFQGSRIYPDSVIFTGRSAYARTEGMSGSYTRINGARPLEITVSGKLCPEEMSFYADLLERLSGGEEVVIDGFHITKSVLYQGEAGFKAGCELGEYTIKLGGADYE